MGRNKQKQKASPTSVKAIGVPVDLPAANKSGRKLLLKTIFLIRHTVCTGKDTQGT